MRISIIILLVSTLIVVHTPCISQENPWKLGKNKNGISVYTKVDTISDNIVFKASITLETTIDQLLDVFYDVDHYTVWMADTKVAKTLKEINKNERYMLFEADIPWPIKNRDMPVYQIISKTDFGAEISFDGRSNYIPLREGIVRIKDVKGLWTLTSLANDKVDITYQFSGDPGLNFPNWVMRLFIVDGPYKSLANLKNLIAKNKRRSRN